MARKKVIVKRINAIQNLGAMDVLCTDKTGTLTMDRVILSSHCNVVLKPDESVLALAYLNSHFQTGLKNVMDRAILAHSEAEHHREHMPGFETVDEIPFDFERRIMSVVVRTPEGKDRIISKGAPEAVFPRCKTFELAGELSPMEHPHIDELRREYEQLGRKDSASSPLRRKTWMQRTRATSAMTSTISFSRDTSPSSTRQKTPRQRLSARWNNTAWP
jgi:Mg2+-importing ATPase